VKIIRFIAAKTWEFVRNVGYFFAVIVIVAIVETLGDRGDPLDPEGSEDEQND